MASNPSAAKVFLFGRTKLSIALSEALQEYVGNRAGRRFSYERLEKHTGVDARRIKAARSDPDSGEWRPLEPEEVFSLMAYMGAGFTSALLKHLGQGAFELPDPDGGDLSRIAPEIANASAEVTSGALRGGNVVGIETANTLIRAGKQLAADAVARNGQGDLFARGGKAA